MELGKLPAEADAPLRPEGVGKILECVLKLVRRFIENHSAPFGFQGVQMLPTAFFVRGQKALEAEAPGRQAGDAQRRDRRTGAGNGADAHARLCAERDQILAGIGDGGGTGVGHKRTALAGKQSLDDARAAFIFVVLIIADKRLFQLQMVEKLQGNPRVLRSDEIRLRERFFRTRGDIAQIADRRGNKIKRTGHVKPPDDDRFGGNPRFRLRLRRKDKGPGQIAAPDGRPAAPPEERGKRSLRPDGAPDAGASAPDGGGSAHRSAPRVAPAYGQRKNALRF